jgi:hypothetical protein
MRKRCPQGGSEGINNIGLVVFRHEFGRASLAARPAKNPTTKSEDQRSTILLDTRVSGAFTGERKSFQLRFLPFLF